MRRTTFHEVMAGTVRLDGHERPMRLELEADLPETLRPWGDVEGTISGRVHVPGWADDDEANGTLRVAPIAARRIRYRLDFTTGDGRAAHLDGWKSVSYRRPLHSMTHLPATITDDDGRVLGEARLRFDARRDLWSFLTGFRLPRGPAATGGDARELLRSRWRGQHGRLEVWYTTLTDPATGTGVWIHHELVAPHDGAPPRAHGWAAVFPPGETPVLERFGPHAWSPSPAFAVPGVELTGERLRGRAGGLSWDLETSGGGAPLYPFPRWAWHRETLPAAQIVPAPGAVFNGTVRWGERTLDVRDATGATARIYGHGNAKRWAWLHADLGDGDVCEVVAAVSTRKGLDRLPPLPFVRLRIGGADWPAGDPLLAALRMRATIGLPSWTVSGRSGDHMVRVEVTQPPGETVAVDYTDPDGAAAVCHNTERADATITLLRREGGRWRTVCRRHLDGTAHAEVGLR